MLSIFIAIILGDPVPKIIRDCDASKKTVSAFCGLVGEVCNLFNVSQREHCSYEYIQADETAIGRRKYHRGRRQRQSGPLWVQTVAGIDPCSGKVLYVSSSYVPDRSANSLEPLIMDMAADRTLLVTDQLRSYQTIVSRNTHFFSEHQTINHSKQFRNDAGFTTNAIESVNNVLKTEIRKRFFHYCPPDAQTGVERLAIATFVTNCRLSKEDLVLRFFAAMRMAHQMLEADA
ncbi:conserved hypothetical protein [Perkinsus marinus ATCC 50983]|uniref:ISXO2-like transposase domain-containing protein n=1 Tax=Perkinsus marinus (strain ATCC 50983 / TXsc) TaxID=423536 RepID=C5KB61_PERM5|nr:conserved hypothetical protein [Perkinsus marinus ATCC 50983]EER18387.1 conserved hypothetical protein [Perkinsus marinus ATCC 50983]|eukprot:XP_002786591.1 conserved hypothetical protein [Perkinsus marinus ATCC 50983]